MPNEAALCFSPFWGGGKFTFRKGDRTNISVLNSCYLSLFSKGLLNADFSSSLKNPEI